MDKIRLNIAIKPSRKVAEYAIKKGGELSKFGKPVFVLDRDSILPHLSVYAPDFPTKNIGQIRKELNQLANEIETFRARFIHPFAVEGWSGMYIERNSSVLDLQRKIVDVLNPLREGLIRDKYKTKEFLEKSSREARDNIKKYGYNKVAELYNPHLTLIMFANNDVAEQAARSLDWEIDEMKIQSLGLYKMGEHGTCVELIEEFELNGQAE